MANSITITCPNPDIISRLQRDITRVLSAYQATFSDGHLKRGASLAVLSHAPVVSDELMDTIVTIVNYLADEEGSYDEWVEDGNEPRDHIYFHRNALAALLQA